MSKAFTRESDDQAGEEIIASRPPAQGGKNYITRPGADRLRNELSALLEQRRALLDHKAAGDLDASANLRRVEAQMVKLESALESLIVVDAPADPGKVALGASVRVRAADGAEETCQIVGPNEADPTHGRISAASPLARALMNRRAGDTVRFISPTGQQELTILEVRY